MNESNYKPITRIVSFYKKLTTQPTRDYQSLNSMLRIKYDSLAQWKRPLAPTSVHLAQWPSHCCANAVICLIIYNSCSESAWNASFYCISGEKIQIQVYCISDTDTRYRSRTYLVISGFRHPGTYPKKTVGFLEYTHLKKPTPKKPTLLL